MMGKSNKREVRSGGAARVDLIRDFDKLPDGALISVETAAAIQDIGESTAWARLKSDPLHPPAIKLSSRCTRIQVGPFREYIRAKVAA